jgi:ElaB/YqjD/DUF883 family membrane-anchored ribosome-binding protein
LDRVITSLKKDVQQAEDFLRSTADASSDGLGEVRHRLQGALDSAHAAMGQVEEKAVACAQLTKRTMREHVFESVGVALGIGLLLGIALRRR